MKKLILTAAVLTATGIAFPAFSEEDKENAKENATTVKSTEQTQCPVMTGKINKKIYVDYQGKRIYFCCSGCPAEFKKDPEKYINKMESEGIVLEKAPEAK
jgi:YHS domain-containing protein